MSRDMKPRKARPSGNRKKSGGGTLIGLFLGLVIGVVAAAGVVWYINKSPAPFADKGPRPTAAVPSAAARDRMLSAANPDSSTILSAAEAISSVVNRARMSNPLTSTSYVLKCRRYVQCTYVRSRDDISNPGRAVGLRQRG